MYFHINTYYVVCRTTTDASLVLKYVSSTSNLPVPLPPVIRLRLWFGVGRVVGNMGWVEVKHSRKGVAGDMDRVGLRLR